MDALEELQVERDQVNSELATKRQYLSVLRKEIEALQKEQERIANALNEELRNLIDATTKRATK